MSAILQYGLYLAILVILAIPLGAYIKKVMDGEKTFLSRILTPCENAVYKVMRIKKEEEMSWKKYAVSVLIFSGIGLIFLFLLQLLQGVLPGNPQNLPGVKWDLSFNTAVSFVTNTNWQAYSGESTLSYLSQALGLTVQNMGRSRMPGHSHCDSRRQRYRSGSPKRCGQFEQSRCAWLLRTSVCLLLSGRQ